MQDAQDAISPGHKQHILGTLSPVLPNLRKHLLRTRRETFLELFSLNCVFVCQRGLSHSGVAKRGRSLVATTTGGRVHYAVHNFMIIINFMFATSAK